MTAADEVIARDGTFAVKHYVERALRARSGQGLPAAIEDEETLDKLALLMSATDAQPASNVIDAMSSTAERQRPVDAADLVRCPRPAPFIQPRRRHRRDGGRPRPGANQFGAGSFSTQHVAGYGEDATPDSRERRRGGVA
jgi:hypothetical protein